MKTLLGRLGSLCVSSRERRPQVPQGSDSSSRSSHSGDIAVRIVRSARRRKTVSARLLDWHTLEIRAPATLSEAELRQFVQRFVEQAMEMRRKMRHFPSDERLEQRATRLNQTLFGGALRWRSIRFAANQHKSFGSCTPALGTIRISKRLAEAPPFVLDYVIVHELAHLREPNHSRAFWDLVYRYDKTERARGYLMALQMEEDAIAGDGSADSEVTED